MVDDLTCCFRGLPHWCKDPKQTVNYVSCHDNNTLMDRISLAVPDASFEDRVRMNKLAAAFYLTAQGIPFMQAGEEMLRSKPDSKGGFVENSYCSSDKINSIKWNLLEKKAYRETYTYYKGLLRLRKAHPVLRMTAVYDILSNLVPVHCENPQVLAFQLSGNVPGEPADEMFIAFNAAESAVSVGLPKGTWKICVDGDQAGTESLGIAEKEITVAPISAMVLVKGSLK
jgi:pullulanase